MRYVQDPSRPVQHAHALFNMGREVEGTEELDRVIVCFEDLGDFESKHATV